MLHTAAILSLREFYPQKHDADAAFRVVCAYFNCFPHELRSSCRIERLVKARHTYCYVAHKYCGSSFPSIGRVLNKDHSTTHHGYQKVVNNMVAFSASINAVLEVLDCGECVAA
jgi:chromosomal replication initiation ATPase DnaA